MSRKNSQSALAVPLSKASMTDAEDKAQPGASPTTESHAKNDRTCMLVADATPDCLPVHLQRLLQHYDQHAAPQTEVFFVLVYAVALESGFVPKHAAAQCAAIGEPLQRLPATGTYHMGNIGQLSQMRPAFKVDAGKSIFECRLVNFVDVASPVLGKYETHLDTLLTGLVTGESMIVSLSPGKFDDSQWPHLTGRSLCLSVSRYALNMRLAKGKPLCRLFRNLDELSLRLRNEFYIPMRNQQLRLFANEIYMYPSLEGLPIELYDNIFQHLSERELKKLANVSRTLNDCAKRSRYFRI